MFNYASLTDIVGMFIAWALGLYVLTRSPRSLLSTVAAATHFAVALYFFGSAMLSNLRDLAEWRAWSGSLWWAAPVGLTLWYWTSAIALRRASDVIPSWYRRFVAYPLGVILSFAALGFAVAILAGDSLIDWGQPVPIPESSTTSSWHAFPGPVFRWFSVSVALSVVVPLIHFTWLWRRVPRTSAVRAQARWLAMSAVLIVVGTNWLATNTLLRDVDLPQLFGFIQVGNLFMIGGLGLLGWTVVRHGTWIEGEPQRGDFAYFLTGLGLVTAIYVVLFVLVIVLGGLPLTLSSLILSFTLGLLVLTTHALADVARVTLGRLFFPDAWETQARFLKYAGQAGRASDHTAVLRQAARESEEQWWYEQTERALRRLDNPHALAQQAIGLRLEFGADSPLDRARELSDLLAACIEKLEPGDGRPTPRPCLILREAYVQRRTTREIMNRHQIPEKTYFNERKKGVAAVAAELQAQARA